jgi:hypothetical protein
VVYYDAYLMRKQIFDAEYLQLQLYCWLLYWSSHNQTKLKKRKLSSSFFWNNFLFLLSSSSTRHIIYHYEINDKFFRDFKTRLLFQMDNYSAKNFYVSYFHFRSITNWVFSTFRYKLRFFNVTFQLYSVISP